MKLKLYIFCTIVLLFFPQGQSPLFLAAREGHIEAVRLLLECFANRNIVDNMDRSPMMIADERKHSAVARMLGEWNITALSHDGTMVQALAHASHMAAAMTSPSGVRRRQPADSFFHQIEASHPNVPQSQHSYEMFCPGGNPPSGHPKMEYHSPLEYHLQCDQIPIGSSGPSTSVQPSVSIHDQFTHQGTGQMPVHNSHVVPSISVDKNSALHPHLMPNISPPVNGTSLAVSRVSSNNSGSPASILSPSNTSPLCHIDELQPTSYPTKTSVGQTVTTYQRDSMGNDSTGSENTLLAENTSFPTPPSAFSCDAYPYSPFTLAAADSVYLTPPPDPESPERWLSSPGKGKSPNVRPMTNLPLGIVAEELPPPYPGLSEISYSVGGQ